MKATTTKNNVVETMNASSDNNVNIMDSLAQLTQEEREELRAMLRGQLAAARKQAKIFSDFLQKEREKARESWSEDKRAEYEKRATLAAEKATLAGNVEDTLHEIGLVIKAVRFELEKDEYATLREYYGTPKQVNRSYFLEKDGVFYAVAKPSKSVAENADYIKGVDLSGNVHYFKKLTGKSVVKNALRCLECRASVQKHLEKKLGLTKVKAIASVKQAFVQSFENETK